MKGFTQMWRDDAGIPDAPWNNSSDHFSLIEQSLGDTKIMPGKEYIIWFSFKDNKPHEIYLNFGLFAAADPLYFKSEIQRVLRLR